MLWAVSWWPAATSLQPGSWLQRCDVVSHLLEITLWLFFLFKVKVEVAVWGSCGKKLQRKTYVRACGRGWPHTCILCVTPHTLHPVPDECNLPTASDGAVRRPGLEGASVKTLGAPDLRAAVCSLADTTGGWEEPGQSSAAACRNKNSCRRWWKNRLSWRSLSSTRSDRNELPLTSCASPTSGSSVEAGGHLVIITSYFLGFFFFYPFLPSFYFFFF